MQKMLKKMASNWKSGITVSLVSIPLSVSLAIASHATPVEGIITAIWAGLLASIFGGSNYNIVGPTGALSGIIASFAITNGNGLLPVLTILTGLFILLAYLAKIEKYLVFVPASTIHGFTLGVAFIIAFNQFNFAFGLSGLTAHEKFFNNVIESFKHINSASPTTFIIFLIFLILLFLITKFLPKLPGAIILSPIGILLGYLSVNNFISLKLTTLGQKYTNITPTLFKMPNWQWDNSVISAAIAIAVVAILETMLSAKVADQMTKTKHDKRKEMFGLGLANLASGLSGGIPATAALARTALNIKTGANDKISATISSISIAIISLIFLAYFKFLPLAVIAAILVFVAIRMVEAEHFERMFNFDKKSLVISLLVAAVTIYEDPIIGILFGTALSLILFMEKLSKGQFELIINDQNKKITKVITGEKIDPVNDESDTLVYSIKGQLAYINSEAHIERFEKSLNGYQNIILRLRELYYIDLDGINALDEIISLIERQGKKVFISGTNSLNLDALKESKKFCELQNQGQIFNRTSEALRFIGYNLNANYHLENLEQT